ncbi:MAG: rhodanese-like domain-containing protein [Burkholderiaceae bacterium]|nr:rhodanese-like domain-containing protein [Burkholderiaceae bacterium]
MKFIIDNWYWVVLAIVSGAMLLWPLIQNMKGGALSAQGAVQLINRERAVVVDVREPGEFAAGHMGGARNVPLGQLQEKLPGVAKNKTVPLLLTCETGARAQRAVAIAKKLGYQKAQSITGGFRAWKEANLPVEKGAGKPSAKA